MVLTIQQINLFQQLRRKLDKPVTFACEVFPDLQKVSATANDDILLKKLEYCWIKANTNNWFYPYLNERMQVTTVNNCKSSKDYLKYYVLKKSVSGPLLSLLFI